MPYINFSSWLYRVWRPLNIAKSKFAEYCHMTPLTIYNAFKGRKPKYADVVTYCHVIYKLGGQRFDPDDIWEHVEKEYEEDY